MATANCAATTRLFSNDAGDYDEDATVLIDDEDETALREPDGPGEEGLFADAERRVPLNPEAARTDTEAWDAIMEYANEIMQ